MVFVLFEVTVKKEGMDQYLALAGELKENLVHAKGFIRAERFSSLSQEGKLLESFRLGERRNRPELAKSGTSPNEPVTRTRHSFRERLPIA